MNTFRLFLPVVAAFSLALPSTGLSRDRHDHDRGDHRSWDRHHGSWGHGSWGHGSWGRSSWGRSYYRPSFGYGYYGYPYSYGYGYPYYYPRSSFGISFSSRPYYGGYYSSPVYAGRSVGYSDDLAVDVQRELRRRGYYRGSIDGDIGPASRAAIRSYQADRGLRVTGRIDSSLLRSLGIG
jgi:hypothetical protein